MRDNGARRVNGGLVISTVLVIERRSRLVATALLVLALAIPALAPARAVAAEVSPPAVSVPAALVQTLDGTVPMWSRRATTERHAASTIKMLTALVVRDRAAMGDVVVIPRRAEAITDGDVGLVTGQRISVRRLMRMMLVASANDAAEALAIHVAGSEGAFVRMMNAKAKELGLTHTTAVDPHGLSERELVSAGDLAVLARHVMADPELKKIVAMRTAVVPLPGGGTRTVGATNKLLGAYGGIEGVKTGYTSDAGFCFVAAAKRGDVELVGVVMGARSNDARFAQMRKLLDWGFAHSRMRTLVATGTVLGEVPVVGGSESTVTVHAIRPLSAIEFDGQPLEIRTSLFPEVRAPVRAGEKLGTLAVYRGATLVGRRGLYADRSVPVVPAPAEPVETPRLGKAIELAFTWGGLRELFLAIRA